MKRKILVVGGNGYIGSRLCQYLSFHGYSVTALCYPAIPDNKEWQECLYKVVVGDIRDEKMLHELAEDDYHAIIDLVSLDHYQSNGSPAFVCPINVTSVWSLLDIFSKKGLKQFIYFSTIHVYGQLSAGLITEEHATNPLTPYALTHAIGEQICDYYNRTTSVRCSVARLSNSYGAPIFNDSNCWWLVVNDLCRMAYERKEIVLQSDGTPLRDFIHGWDVCGGIKCLLEAKDVDGVFHLSSGKTNTIAELAERVKYVFRQRYAIDIPVFLKSLEHKALEAEEYQISNNKLIAKGFQQEWELEQGINDLFSYLEIGHEK